MNRAGLSAVTEQDLLALVGALDRGDLRAPMSATSLQSNGFGHLVEPLAPHLGLGPDGLRAIADVVLAERRHRRAPRLTLVWTGDDPGVARRAARDQAAARPDIPAGKGWTPRAGDDGWMTDFDAWADEHDDLAPDVPRSGKRKAVTMAPIALFAAAVVCVFLGLVVQLEELVAVGAVCVIFAGGLFIMLPMYEMSRGRRR